jgi:hypothetical protein
MSTARKTAIAVGALFLISYAGLIIGSSFLEPVINAPDYLANVYPNKTQVVTGVVLEFVNAAAVIGIAVLLFPLFKHYSESLALGYVGFRVIEAVFSILSSISPLPLIDLSQAYIQAGAPDAPYFQTLGVFALAGRYWASQMLVVFFILAALILYYVLYQSKLLPRFIPIWGFIAIAAIIAANLIEVPDFAEGFHPAQLLVLPIILNELFLAIWLIVKGFRPSAIPAGAA